MASGLSSFALSGPTQKQRVSYFYDDDVGNYTYGLGHPMKPHRVRMCHSLVTNYGLYKKMDVIRPKRATARQMTRFHNDEYVDFLYRLTPDMVGGEGMSESTKHLFNLGDDCPVFDGLFEFCSISAGGSIAAANKLTRGESDIAINWAGGLHHAKKTEASGFCYINDIVLAILELLRFHQRVLYIDIDIHHGDGVEEAFYTTDRVMTASFHMTEFFPGTGKLEETGIGKGKNYAVNVPLQKGMDDWSYQNLFEPVIKHIMEWYRPGAVVLQCGADSLAGDKLGCFNLSMKGHANCVAYVKSFGVPMIVVGGGGYTIRNVARAWTFETAVLLDEQLPEELPFNSYFEYYGPEYRLDVPANNMKNDNTPEDLHNLKAQIIENLRHIPCAPSVQMQEVPRDYTSSDDEDEDVDFDTRISRRLQDSRIVPDEELSDSDDEDGRRNHHDANGSFMERSTGASTSAFGSGSGRLSGRVTTTSAAHNFSSPLGTNGSSAGAATSHTRKFAAGAPSDLSQSSSNNAQAEWNQQAVSTKSSKGGQGSSAGNGAGASSAARRGRAVTSSSQKLSSKDQQAMSQQGTYTPQPSKGREIHSKEYQPRDSHHRELAHHGPSGPHPQQGTHTHGQAIQPPHPSQSGPSHHHHGRDPQMQMQHPQRDHMMHRELAQHRDSHMMREQEQRELEQREHMHQLQMHQQRRAGGSSSSSRSDYHSQYGVDEMMRYGGPPPPGGSGYGGYSMPGDRMEEGGPMGHKDRKDHYKDSSSNMDLDDPRMMETRPPPPPHGGPPPGMPPMGHHSHPSHGGGGSMDYGRMMPGGSTAPPPHYGHRRGGSHGGSQGDLRGAMMGGEPGGPPGGPYGGWERERMERERERERHHGYRGPNAP
ncbi:hypothetical protein EC968_007587 [Mortierella alpina]|nr:hypothetical protein EC968_007587 [Mortierella alpina]